MTQKIEITQDGLKEILNYEPESGLFTWKDRDRKYFYSDASCKGWHIRFSGKIAGGKQKHPDGKIYWQIGINRKVFFAHRLAWIYMTGEIPDQIDHKDGNGTNNKWGNLRSASPLENMRNLRKNSRNKSGHNGVFWIKKLNKWCAHLYVKRERIVLGYFVNIEDAVEARKEANIKYGFHANHGMERAL